MSSNEKWAVKSQSCPDDYDPAWHNFGSRAEAEAWCVRERYDNPTDLLTIFPPDFGEPFTFRGGAR